MTKQRRGPRPPITPRRVEPIPEATRTARAKWLWAHVERDCQDLEKRLRILHVEVADAMNMAREGGLPEGQADVIAKLAAQVVRIQARIEGQTEAIEVLTLSQPVLGGQP